MTPWQPSRGWYRDPDHAYTIELPLDPDVLVPLWAAVRAEQGARWVDAGTRLDDPHELVVGGAFVRRESDRLIACSGGEDALDSLGDIADLVDDAAARLGIPPLTGWVETPPLRV